MLFQFKKFSSFISLEQKMKEERSAEIFLFDFYFAIRIIDL